MVAKSGNLSINSDNIFPISKKWLYSDQDIFYRELISNGCDAITKLKKLDMMGEYALPEDFKPRIDVQIHPEKKTIKITDNGIGMTEEFKTHIFESFVREDSSRVHKTEGSGLGMAITKYIVDAMGGIIEVDSTPGEGTNFHVSLDLERADVLEANIVLPAWSILVVDDDQENGKNIQMLMKEVGVETDTACSMEEALGRLMQAGEAGEGYSVVLLDWDTSGIGCIQAVKRMREALPDTAAVLLLADYGAEGVEEALQMERTQCIAKPFFVSAFKEKISEMRSQASGREEEKEDEDNGLQGLHFLAAEDNEINAEILAELLDIEGAKCEIVEDGQLALERFENSAEGEFDAILMDVQMPVMNGYEATRRIRALERKDAEQILIIAMTANAFAEDVKDALDAGMNAHLAKPIDMELLKKMIHQYI